jgi:peptidoglycan/xylan/chitin deacetylase (PgdA/CDA1 family)
MSGARRALAEAEAHGDPRLPRHDRYDYLPLPLRADYSWPGGRRLAVTLVAHAEWFAFGAGLGDDPAKPGEPQTHRNYAWRDYGNRVGAWNLLELLDELGLPAAHCVDTLVYREAPQLTDAIRARGDELVAHGRTNAENLRGLWPADEARMLQEVTDTITRHAGAAPRGWMGAAAYETPITPDPLREIGYTYLMDWPMDDQPVWMRTRSGPMLVVPYPVEIDDAQGLIHRKWTTGAFCDAITGQFDEMVERCEQRPLVMNVSVHPNVFGQPFRVRALRRALKHCLDHPLAGRVWWCRPGDIAAHCATLPVGTMPGR